MFSAVKLWVLLGIIFLIVVLVVAFSIIGLANPLTQYLAFAVIFLYFRPNIADAKKFVERDDKDGFFRLLAAAVADKAFLLHNRALRLLGRFSELGLVEESATLEMRRVISGASKYRIFAVENSLELLEEIGGNPIFFGSRYGCFAIAPLNLEVSKKGASGEEKRSLKEWRELKKEQRFFIFAVKKFLPEAIATSIIIDFSESEAKSA